MSNQKISAMANFSAPLSGAEFLPLVQSGGNVHATFDAFVAQIFAYGSAHPTPAFLAFNNSGVIGNVGIANNAEIGPGVSLQNAAGNNSITAGNDGRVAFSDSSGNFFQTDFTPYIYMQSDGFVALAGGSGAGARLDIGNPDTGSMLLNCQNDFVLQCTAFSMNGAYGVNGSFTFGTASVTITNGIITGVS